MFRASKKAGKSKTSKKKVKKTAKRKSYRKKKRRRKDRRISLIGTAGAVGSMFVPRTPDAMSMGQWLKEWLTQEREFKPEDMNDFLADTVGQYTGFDWRENKARWSVPWATVTIIATGFAARIANKYGGKYLKNLPLVGKHIKF